MPRIRNGHLNRQRQLSGRRFDGEFPHKWFKDFIEYLKISEEQFYEVIDRIVLLILGENLTRL